MTVFDAYELADSWHPSVNMTASLLLQRIINDARQEIERNNPLRHVFKYEQAVLEKLLHAIDTQNDLELSTTIFNIKTEFDRSRCSVGTVLPALLNILPNELKRPAREH